MEYLERDLLRIPVLGFGTAGLRGDACVEAVADALTIGYRHLDTAVVYDNEASVGAGIRDAGMAREELFVTTKLAEDDLAPDAVRGSLEGSLQRLDTDYVDLWLIHWPNPKIPLRETLDAMAELLDAGWARYLGVSNFSRELFEQAATIAPVVCNQVEYHPYKRQDDVVAAARERDAWVTAYSPLAKGEVVNDPVLQEIGETYGKTAAQVALRWLIQQRGVVAIPKAARPEHRQANLDLFDFALTDEEMVKVDHLTAPFASSA